LRQQAQEQGWLDCAKSLPPDEALVAVLQQPKQTRACE
jgi:hypothetical protein